MASATTCGLILLGNSGVGKSFLANRLLDDDEAFESRFAAGSVTRHTEWKDMPTNIGRYTFSVANIPGLVEANQKLIDENRVEIMKAFEQCPWAIVLFVFGQNNGRIPDEDLVAFMRINDAYEFPTKSLLLIVNGIPADRPRDYEAKTAQLLEELTSIDKSYIYFIEKSTSENSKRDIRDLLCEAISKCDPVHHERKHDIELMSDEISRLKMESKNRQDQLLAQETEHSKKQKLSTTLHKHQSSSQRLSATTPKPKPDFTNDKKRFDDMMEAIDAEHARNMEKLKRIQENSNTAAIQQLTDQMKAENDLNKELLDHMSTSPKVVIVREKKREKGLTKILNAVGDFIFGEQQSDEPEQQGASRRYQSSASRPSNHPYQRPANN
ncbi:unnamed protein product [Adineta ricciae]|uniref:AIG1-type G domain-containing protein n=1 Tax=Adineta ricciae TaxID=249248 RepID=A0A816AK16_ADIRI|nr:unnamed protein product [Adineta ricciae]CAF1596939.1 unnamed protein product [Adineta ricciae]